MELAKTPNGGLPLSREKVTEVIATVVAKMGDRMSTTQGRIATELEVLATQIDLLYTELAALNPTAINSSHIPTAHDELSAVVDSTAEATSRIMDECEKISKAVAGADPAVADAVSSGVMSIYEACSFQDITGQRIKKVVKTLKLIEEKVGNMLAMLGHDRGSPAPEKGHDPMDEAALLNGPSMPGQGISQEEIDKLLGF